MLASPAPEINLQNEWVNKGEPTFLSVCCGLVGSLGCGCWGGTHGLKAPARVIMKTYNPVSENLTATEPENGGKAEGNCVAVRQGGKQPDAKEQSQTKVNSIRRVSTASLRATGEACAKREPERREGPGSVDTGVDTRGWSGNAAKEICLNGESCPERSRRGNPERRAAVRAAVRAKKSGNADGAKGGRKANASSERLSEVNPAIVPAEKADKQAGETLWHRHKAERGVWSEKMLKTLERGVKGGRWFSLIDKVRAERTLSLAWEKVRSNAGACGVDNITVARFTKDSQTRLLAVKEQLTSGRYQPKPVKRVWIPKPGKKNEKRPLGIPAVIDRVVQQALRLVLEPIFEHRFAEHSYGFRPGPSCHDALRRVDGQLVDGHHHVVDMSVTNAHFDFLGYRFKRSGRGSVLRLARPKSTTKLKEGIRKWTKRCNGHAMEEIIRRINPRLRGWFNYFKQAHPSVHRSMDGWVRMRLRSVYRKRQKKRGRGRGIDHQLWPNRHFAQIGLFSLEAAKIQAISLHNRR